MRVMKVDRVMMVDGDGGCMGGGGMGGWIATDGSQAKT
jgi:hypothetical protein